MARTQPSSRGITTYALTILQIPFWVLAWLVMACMYLSGPVWRAFRQFAWARKFEWSIGHFAWYGEIDLSYTPFNRRKWLAHSHPKDSDTTRVNMSTDLLSHYLEDGTSLEQIVSLLGQPDSKVARDDYLGQKGSMIQGEAVSKVTQYQYRLGKNRIGFQQYLMIHFDAADQVCAAYGSSGSANSFQPGAGRF